MAVDTVDPLKTIEANQTNIYILAGVFSGFIFLLLVLVSILFYRNSKLSKELRRRGPPGHQPINQNVPPTTTTINQSGHQYGQAVREPVAGPAVQSSEDELAMRGFQTYAPKDDRYPPKLPPPNFPHGNSPRPNSALGAGGGNRQQSVQSPSGQQGDGQSSYQRNLAMADQVWNVIPAELKDAAKDAAKDEAISQFKSLF